MMPERARRRSVRGLLAAAVAVAAGIACVVPASAADAPLNGDKTVGCSVDWNAGAILDAKLPNYSNVGYTEKVQASLGSPGQFEVQHYITSEINFRIYVRTVHPIHSAKLRVELPEVGEYRVSDLNSEPAKYEPEVKDLTANKPPAVPTTSAAKTMIDLGDMAANSASVVEFTGTVQPERVNDTYVANAAVTGTYAEGAGCPVTTPALPAAPTGGRCEQVVTGRTVMSTPASAVETRVGGGTGGVTNADGTGSGATRTFRVYGATDNELQNVTYTATAAQGMKFDPGGVVVRTPADAGSSPGREYTGAVTGAGTPVVSSDGKTLSVTIASMPAGSSFDMPVTGRLDGSWRAMVVDHVLRGTRTVCPPPTSAPGPVPTSAPSPTPGPTSTTMPVPGPAPTPLPGPTMLPLPKPGPPTVKPIPGMSTRTFQVDRYTPRTSRQAKVVARLAADGRLAYREDRPLWGASVHQFVTVRVPQNATSEQVVAAINRATGPRVGDVTTTRRLTHATRKQSYVIAWELGRGVGPSAPWGPRYRTAQTFFARS